MNKSLIKCNIWWILFVIIVAFTGISTMKPDLTKKWLTENASGFVDLFNLKNEPQEEQETYIKRNRSHIEPSVFEQSE